MTVAGVDACKGGWIAVLLHDSGRAVGIIGATLADLAEQATEAEVFAVDIPIGLPIAGRRRADLEARKLLGPRRNSVFFTPIREALEASTHREASAVSKRLTGQAISQHA
jgi:predicted RNase H-like nuclease